LAKREDWEGRVEEPGDTTGGEYKMGMMGAIKKSMFELGELKLEEFGWEN